MIGLFESIVVIHIALERVGFLLLHLVDVLEDTLQRRLTLDELDEGAECLAILGSLNMEVRLLEALVKIFVFEDELDAILARLADHIPVEVLDEEAAVVGERFCVLRKVALSEQLHVHLVVSCLGQFLDR